MGYFAITRNFVVIFYLPVLTKKFKKNQNNFDEKTKERRT